MLSSIDVARTRPSSPAGRWNEAGTTAVFLRNAKRKEKHHDASNTLFFSPEKGNNVHHHDKLWKLPCKVWKDK